MGKSGLVFFSQCQEKGEMKCNCFMIIIPTVEEKDFLFLLLVPRA